MDNLVEKQKYVLNHTTRLTVAFSFIIHFAILTAGYQILSEEELANAGIHLDKYRNEEIL